MPEKNAPMRVLWFVNTAFPAMDRHLGKEEYLGTGWWVKATANEMAKLEGLEIGVAWASSEVRKYERFEEEGFVYYLIPQHPFSVKRRNIISRIWSRLNRVFSTFLPYRYENEIRDCVRAVDDFKPDVVHVWGTENFYGLICNKINVPVLIKLQGLLSVIQIDYWGGLKLRERASMPNEILYYLDTKKRAKNEIKIVRENRFFEGRTLWDYSHMREYNTSASYYDIPEMMRPSFYVSEWEIEKAKRYTVYTTSRSMPPKGVLCLLKSISIVRKYIPDVQLRIGGHTGNVEYGRHIKKMMSDLELDSSVTFLGPVSENEIIRELLSAHVYVLPSFIENSSNSLIEAEMVGVPCIASYVGGSPSLMSEEETGLFFQKGDSAMLAMNIQRVFNDDELAIRLSKGAREFALDRFSKDRVIGGILSAYKEIVEQEDAG